MNNARKNIKTWKNKKGNLCFCYDTPQPMEKPLRIIVVSLCFGCVVLVEYLCFTTIYSLLPLAFLLYFAYWIVYPCKNNEGIERRMMNKNVDLRLHNELKKFDKDIHEVKRKFYQVSKGTYGIVTGTYTLVLLSNNEVLEYELKYHKPTETKRAFYEFVKKPIKCINPEHRKVVEIKSLAKWWIKIKIPEKVMLSSIIFVIVGVGIVFTSFYLWLMSKFEWKAVVYLIGYLVVFMCLQWLTDKIRNKMLIIFNFIFSLPMLIIKIWSKLMLPTMTILMSYIFLGLYAFGLPMLIIKGLDFLLDLNISEATIFFIAFAIGSIISVHGSRFISWMIKEYSPLKNWENHKYEAVMTELALYVINKNNVNFLIYLTYFLYLSISGFMQIQYNESLITTNIDGAILKAFLVFIAFSKMVSKSKNIEIKAKPLLNKMIRLITVDDE